MPYRKSYRKRRTRRKAGKKKYSVSRRKLSDKRINTLFEKRAQEIAKQEIKKNEIRLILRRFWLFGGTYSTDTNLHIGGAKVSWTGLCLPVSKIAKTDVEFVSVVAMVDVPESKVQENVHPGDYSDALAAVGSGFGGTDADLMGHRSSNIIRVSGFSVDIRAFIDRLQEEDQPYLDVAVVKYRLVSIYGRHHSEGQAPDADWRPDIKKVFPWRSWGYSSKIDHVEAELTATCGYKYKVLARGSFKMKPSVNRSSQTNHKRYFSLTKKSKNGLVITYDDADQSGAYANKQLFLLLRSQVPEAYVNECPEVQIVTKTFYTCA